MITANGGETNARRNLYGVLLAISFAAPIAVLAQGPDWVTNPLNAGPPRLPAGIIMFCKSQTGMSHAECLARSGFPPGREALPPALTPLACNMNGCLDIPPAKWDLLKQPFGDQEVQIQYATWFNLSPSSGTAEDWKLKSESQLLLINLQNNIDYQVRRSIKPKTCQVDTTVESRNDSVSGDTYTYAALLRTDVRSCTSVPCVPNIWDQCDAIVDVGRLYNTINVRTRVYVDGENLRARVDSEFIKGDVPENMKVLFKLEEAFNFSTGQIFRSGNQRMYDEAVQDALRSAVEQSGEKLVQRIAVQGARAFKLRPGATRMEMTGKGVVLKLGMNASVPPSMICEVRAALAEMNGFQCRPGR